MKHITKKTQQILAIGMIALLMTVQLSTITVSSVHAAPEKPSAPEQPTEPDSPEEPEEPVEPEQPTEPDSPEEPEEPEEPGEEDSSDSEESEEENSEEEKNNNEENEEEEKSTTNSTNDNEEEEQESQNSSQDTKGEGDGNIGDTEIKSGDANTSGSISNTGNNNASTKDSSGSGSGTIVKNSDNGSDSDNDSSVDSTNDKSTTQNNSAHIKSSLDQESDSGNNSASYNTGGDSSIETGDANTSGTIITAANSNVDGLAVSEFNIVEDHNGDIILDFGEGCIIGCDGGDVLVENSGNGDDSTNSAEVDETNSDTTEQNNLGVVENEMILSANTGDNSASHNVGGDSSIKTGDANVSANSLTFLNNNIAGNVVLGVVNIFGDLIGNIILPAEEIENCSGCVPSQTTASNTENGSGSTNNSDVTLVDDSETFQSNDASIDNNLIIDATTGGNSTSKNTGGNNSIDTGNVNIDANVLNLANMNLLGGDDMWLVIVNEGGNWVGKILGAPEGTNYAGSDNADFDVSENGEITVKNSDNGSDSENTGSVTKTNSSNTTQTNDAQVENNLNLSANTGGNDASKNTGGNSSIDTGDVNIIANLVNFVNNNIIGDGKLYVNMVNVFGSWIGDFIGPGHSADEDKPDNNDSGDNVAHVGGQSGDSNKDGENEKDNEEQNQKVLQTQESAQPTQSVASGVSDGPRGASGNTGGFVYDPLLASVDTQEASEEESEGAVLGAEDEEGPIEINLAWLLALGPALSIGFIERKYAIFRGAAHKLLSLIL